MTMRGARPAGLLLGAALCALLLLAAVVSLLWTPWPPDELDLGAKLAPPSVAHWLGTDQLGRDVASRLLVGARQTLAVGVVAVGLGLGLGLLLGLWAAAQGGFVERALMRAADFSFAFPAILLAVLLGASLGPGMLTAMLAIAIHNVAVFARVARGAARAELRRDYVLAARALGKGRLGILRDHVLPNIAAVLLVQASIQFALAILAEAALSYLGLGTQPPQASWGRMLAEAQSLMYQAPLLAVFPGLAVMLAVLGLNLLGDGLRDVLDPRRRR